MAFEVRDAGAWGQGLFATRNLPAMYLVGLYAGKRGASPPIVDSGDTMQMEDGSYVDASVEGNLTRYINHAEPDKCNAAMFPAGADTRITLIRPVRSGEQITMFYGTDYDYAGHGIDTDEERRYLLDCLTEETIVVPPGFRPMFRLLWALGESNVATKVVLPPITDPVLLEELCDSLAHSQTIEEIEVVSETIPQEMQEIFDLLVAEPTCTLKRFFLVRPRASADDRNEK